MKLDSSQNLVDRFYMVLTGIIGILAFVVVAYPLYFIVIASFSDSTMVNQGLVVLFPKGVNFYGYQKIFEDTRIWNGYVNTIYYTFVGTAINIVVTMTAAYVLSRKYFKPRRVIMALFVFTMYFSGGMIPTYMLMVSLNLINKPLVMLINGTVNVYNLIITRTFIEHTVPEELYEAASMDGCSHFRYFATIVLPLSRAILAVMFLYFMVGHWNDFFTPLLYINKDSLQPLQVVLRNILLSNQAFLNGAGSGAGEGAGGYAQKYADQIKFAVIIVSTIPILCVYPFIQKYFEKGIMIGAIKG
jgi:putative aldouronate transport system permease protein